MSPFQTNYILNENRKAPLLKHFFTKAAPHQAARTKTSSGMTETQTELVIGGNETVRIPDAD